MVVSQEAVENGVWNSPAASISLVFVGAAKVPDTIFNTLLGEIGFIRTRREIGELYR